MNPQMNPPNPGAPSADPPVKRKRGRPRKDETQAQALERSALLLNRPLLRPELSATPTPNIPTTSKGKDPIVANDDDQNNRDEMVGQVVTGVLDCAFDAGYFLTVRVGETDVLMRGVVFKEACVVPVTPENDIAPNSTMYKRKDIPIPAKLAPQQHPAGDSSSKPTENVQNPQIVQNVVLLQGQSSAGAPEEQTVQNPQNATEEPQFKMGFDQIVQNTLPHEAKESSEPVREENPSQVVNEPHSESKETGNESLELSFTEPRLKVQKISEDEETMNYLSADQSCEIAGTSESAVMKTATGEMEATVLPLELLIQPHTAFGGSVPGAMSPVLDPEMGGAAGFQISMENTDNDEPESASAKEAEDKKEPEK